MKNIIVCVKQVPNTTNVKMDPKYHTLVREGISSILNPHDKTAIIAALCCKRRYGFKIGVLTMGPPHAKEILIDCLKMGIDEAFLLTDEKLIGSDTLCTVIALSAMIKKIGYKNVFCGQESIDSSTGHVGPGLAELLNIPQVTHADEILEIINGELIKVKATVGTYTNVLEIKLPVVISFNKSTNEPEKVKETIDETLIKTYNLKDIGINEDEVGIYGSPTWVTDINIDENALNFLRVPSNLSAEQRIRFILSGGIVKKKNQVILKGMSKNIIARLVKVLKVYK